MCNSTVCNHKHRQYALLNTPTHNLVLYILGNNVTCARQNKHIFFVSVLDHELRYYRCNGFHQVVKGFLCPQLGSFLCFQILDSYEDDELLPKKVLRKRFLSKACLSWKVKKKEKCKIFFNLSSFLGKVLLRKCHFMQTDFRTYIKKPIRP